MRGLALAVAIAVVATALGQLVPVIGAPVIAVALGVLVRGLVDPGPRADPGIGFASKRLLQLAIVLLASGLDLGTIVRVGGESLPVMLGTLVAALVGTRYLGRALGVEAPLRTLIGVGTGICGASAIAAVASVVRVDAIEVNYVISTIFVFNIVAVLLFPLLGHLMDLSPQAFGLWAGTAVNDTSSVAAAGYAYGQAAGAYAVVVKLTRTTLIVPIVIALAAAEGRRRGGARALGPRRALGWARAIPGFLLWFLAVAAANSAGLVGASMRLGVAQVALLLIAVALAAVGLSAQPYRIRAAGYVRSCSEARSGCSSPRRAFCSRRSAGDSEARSANEFEVVRTFGGEEVIASKPASAATGSLSPPRRSGSRGWSKRRTATSSRLSCAGSSATSCWSSTRSATCRWSARPPTCSSHSSPAATSAARSSSLQPLLRAVGRNPRRRDGRRGADRPAHPPRDDDHAQGQELPPARTRPGRRPRRNRFIDESIDRVGAVLRPSPPPGKIRGRRQLVHFSLAETGALFGCP